MSAGRRQKLRYWLHAKTSAANPAAFGAQVEVICTLYTQSQQKAMRVGTGIALNQLWKGRPYIIEFRHSYGIGSDHVHDFSSSKASCASWPHSEHMIKGYCDEQQR
jgi:hypothetical protein